jgi:hypothetical protein
MQTTTAPDPDIVELPIGLMDRQTYLKATYDSTPPCEEVGAVNQDAVGGEYG